MLLPDQTYEQGNTNTTTTTTAAATVRPPPPSPPTPPKPAAIAETAVVSKNGKKSTSTPNHPQSTAKSRPISTITAPPKITSPSKPTNQSALRTLFQLTFSSSGSKSTAAQRTDGGNGGGGPRVGTPENFGRTSEFFNNIPDYLGDPLRPFSLHAGGGAAAAAAVRAAAAERGGTPPVAPAGRRVPGATAKAKPAEHSPDVLKECEQFLSTHRIRPDFFCRYRRAVITHHSQSAPPSWPHHQPSPAPAPRTAPHSASPRPFRSGSSRMRRFAKSTAIYTLPARDRRPQQQAASASRSPRQPSAATASSDSHVLAEAEVVPGEVSASASSSESSASSTASSDGTTTSDASSSNEAVHLQQRLKSLSTELVTLRNRLHVGPNAAAAAVNGNAASGGAGHQLNANAPLATSTPNAVGPGQQQQQQQHQPPQLTSGALSTSPPASGPGGAFSASIPIAAPHHSHHKNQKPTYSNQIISNAIAANQAAAAAAAAASAAAQQMVPIVSPRNTSIPHPLPPHVSAIKATDNFSQFGGTLPRRSEIVTAATTPATSGSAGRQPATGSSTHGHHSTATVDRRLGGGGGGNGGGGHGSSLHAASHKATIFGSCNNLLDAMGPPSRHGISAAAHPHATLTRSPRSPPPPLCKPSGSSHAMATAAAAAASGQSLGFGGGGGGDAGQLHWSQQAGGNGNGNAHQHVSSAKCAANGGGGQSTDSAAAANGAVVPAPPKDMDDLIHLPGPLTEDAVMRTLQARFADGKHFTNVGPILLSINPYKDVGNPLTLSSTRSLQLAPQLHRIVQEAVRQQAETGYPQAIILSGTSGAGKTHCSMLLLRQLFAVAGGGPETDAFKHLAAAFTVLRSLGSAKTATNSESSRIGQFIEVQVTDGALYRTKIHCYFLDQTRVIRPLPNEKNYHIFYQMLAGLNRDERAKLNLEGYSPANLRYLQSGDIYQDEKEDAARFQAWKACLGILGIPFLDVVRVLAAVLLLGNVQFVDGPGLEVDVRGEPELNAVAGLLGVQPSALFRGLTTRTHNARGQLVKSVCDANISNMTRDSLAKALYCRTVATIVRRANSLKRLGSTLGTLSSDSNESVHNQADAASQHTSTIGGNAGSKSMAALNNAVRHATDGFIGILDMFGFEEPRPAQLEHLCINLCAETMQHFYNTHIFKSSVESCRDEGIMCDTEIDYVDNVPCIDLISSLRTGLLSMLDAECSVRGTAESYVAKIKVQHRNSTRLESKQADGNCDARVFTIRHFAGRVDYDTSDFLDTNRDVVSDDLVSVFYKHTCNFGFATHLFGSELKALYAVEHVPRGLSFRIAPTSHTDLLNGDEPVSTLTQDFHTRLDNLLRTLVHARPHFVRCIRSNGAETAGRFDRGTVVRQIRALQVLETVNLMASGFPHRMRFKQFTARYRMLAPFRLLRRSEERAMDDCGLILQCAMANPPLVDGSVTLSWAPGKRHVFLSEGIRQHLEKLRVDVRGRSATAIQAVWRGWQLRRRIGPMKRQAGGGGGGGTQRAVGNGGGGGGGGADCLTPATAASCAALLKAAASGNGKARRNADRAERNAQPLIARFSHAATRASATVTNAGGTCLTSGSNKQLTSGANVTAAPSSKCPPTVAAAANVVATRPRPQPIAGTPPPDPNEKCDAKIIQQTCTMFGLDLERPPPVPPSRPYTVTGNSKLGYPQSRVMKMNFPDDSATNSPAEQLLKGETVTVVGASHRRGHLIVESNGISFHVPFQFMELVKSSASTVASLESAAIAALSPSVQVTTAATVAAVVAAATAAAAAATAAATTAAATSSAAAVNVVNLM